jgi:Protein kinase domain
MAEVYLARRRVAGVEKRLVIKRLRKDRSRDPRFLELFMREAQLSMSLVQQNIVPVFDFGRIGDDVFLAMEFIDGKDLGSSLAKERGVGSRTGMSPLLAAFIAAECCQALDHAHRRAENVIHRDVTPRNILISWEGEVKLADFGIAAVVGDASGALGTPGYMAPEQARQEPTDARVDIYALGIVLWEALLGEHVRPSTDRMETIAAAKSGELPPIDPEIVPETLAEIIRHATAKDPGERYASARNMAEALDGFLLAERARDPGRSPSARLAEWLDQRWAGARDDNAAPIPAAAGAVVSFVDDGLDRIGGRTMRSIAETAADEGDLLRTPPPHAIIEDAPADLDSKALPVLELDEPKRPASVTAVPAQRRWLPLVMLLLLLGGGLVAWRMMRRPAGLVVPDDAALGVAAEAASGATADGPIDAPVDAPIDAAPVDARRSAPQDAGRLVIRIDAAPKLPVGEIKSFTIGATPWAYFTIDDDPKQYETPQTLKLTVGPHSVRFTNPQLNVSRTVTVTVPPNDDGRHVEKMN